MAHLLRGEKRIAAGQFREALGDFQTATAIPDNLPVAGRGATDHSSEVAYWTGVAYAGMGDSAKAKESWTKAAGAGETRAGRGGPGRGGAGVMMNPTATYYRALALQKLGRAAEAATLLQDLVRSAEQSLR